MDADHLAVIRAAAQEPKVERIFVNAAIKKALCREARATAAGCQGAAVYGHDYHFHIRINARPAPATATASREPPKRRLRASDLAYWFSDAVLHPKPPKVRRNRSRR